MRDKNIQNFFLSLSFFERAVGVFPLNRVESLLTKFFEAWRETAPLFFLRTTHDKIQLLAQNSQGFSPIYVVFENYKEGNKNATEKFLGQMILSGKLPEKAWESPLPTPPTHSYREGL